MYLKKVEFLGFKSFADRTVMNFLPGMTAIVGPNGCGKSNIADAVRWVLGEQSAKALRGGKMMDVIFNGADGVKPTNLCEVSLTLAECEGVLKTDYHEVTITRRLFRDGKSEYYLNKQPHRLKDILRLFMDTGVGRNSYSILEQGKIDQILSSRPEDRRVVFEEASGITKYKTDRAEALRKLEHTEQNLARLDDVIREVKRRMISLQRQAAKARRYQEIQERLKGRDLWLIRHKLEDMQEAIGNLETNLDGKTKEIDQLREEVEQGDNELSGARAELEEMDKDLATRMETALNLRNELNQARQAVKVNKERMEEMKAYATRDSRDAEEARARLDQHQNSLGEMGDQILEARKTRDEAEAAWQQGQNALQELENRTRESRRALQEKRSSLYGEEQKASKLQGQIRSFDERERGRLVQQERLRGELEDLQPKDAPRQRRVQELELKLEELQQRQQLLRERVDQGSNQQKMHAEQLKEQRKVLNEEERRVAGLKARLDVLHAQEAEKEDFPAGARALLSKEALAGVDKAGVKGALASLIRVTKANQTALEAIMRTWIDAVVVSDPSTQIAVLQALGGEEAQAARVLAVEGFETAAAQEGPGEALCSLIRCKEELRPLVDRLFHGVFVVDDLNDAGRPGAGQCFVSRKGHLIRGNGALEIHAADQDLGNPLALQARITETDSQLKEASERAEQLRAEQEAASGEEGRLQERLRNAREELQGISREEATCESELKNARRELEQGQKRMKQLDHQLQEMAGKHGASDAERSALNDKLEEARAHQERLRKELEEDAQSSEQSEQERNQLAQQATDQRIHFAEQKQKLEMLERQQKNLQDRVRELEQTIQDRNAGVNRHEERVLRLDEELQAALTRIPPLEEKLEQVNQQVSEAKQARAERQNALHELEKALRVKRSRLEALNQEHGRMDVDVAQRRVRYETLIQQSTEHYHLTLPDIFRADEPAWEEEEAPSWEALERNVGEMKDKLEKMGPVNMVAIEEYTEQEDRYQFLMAQQEDLNSAKQQLMDTIKQINETTTQMFNDTFNKVDANFREMFKRIFGGGEARLELVDAEDVLEAGVDIIAKPPGKKPQVISLLSGGERTMTAVALLFALYQVKPSPFCILDELDAALDDANIGRFIGVVQDFLKESQFIVITHNQKTIAAADVLYGVTQERKGVSKVVSVKLTDHDKDPVETARAKQQDPEAVPAG